MDTILSALTRLANGVAPALLVHAPFAHDANITPYASLRARLPYDFGPCTGRAVALFASRDKAETLGLIAQIISRAPASLSIFWPNAYGGKGLADHLKKLDCESWHDARLHARMAHIPHPAQAHTEELDIWAQSAAPKMVPGTALCASPGLFSHRHVDSASALLLAHLPDDLGGMVADFGCGWGYLSDGVLRRCVNVSTMIAIDDDVRAVRQTGANINDARLTCRHGDIVHDDISMRFDAVIMNPPFHCHGKEDRALGQAFVNRAAAVLRPSGRLVMVANRHLPYESNLQACFKSVTIRAEASGFKVIEAVK